MESKNPRFFKYVKFGMVVAIRDFVFEEEYVDILIDVIGINQGLIPDFSKKTTNQENIKEPLI